MLFPGTTLIKNGSSFPPPRLFRAPRLFWREEYNVMIDGQNVFDQPVKNDQRTYDQIRKVMSGQRDDYTTGSLLDYVDFKIFYKTIAIDLSKQ